LPGKVEITKIKSYKVMITELGKRCQEMARIEDFASFKSELLGAPDLSPNFCSPCSSRRLSVFASFQKESSYGRHAHH
jgi:hypothetical protein